MSPKFLLSALVLAFPLAAQATTTTFDFEDTKTADFSPLKGKGADGSQLEVSEDKAHSGKKSLKLNYKSDGGWIEFYPLKAQPADFAGDKLYLSFWVYGSGKRDFAGAGVRILDKHNETFQWTVPGLAEALAGDGWREVKATIDLSKQEGHWGDHADGIIDRPFSWFGIGAGRSSQTKAEGTFYLDDIRVSDQPLPDLPTPVAAAPAQPAPTLTVAPVNAPATGPAADFLKWVLPPGRPANFQLNLALRAPAQGLTLQWKVQDAFDKVLAHDSRAVAEGATEDSAKITIPNPPRGILYVTASISNARGEVLTEAQTRAAVFEPRQKPVPRDPFLWGVAAHVARNNGQDADAEITTMRLLGFALARADMSWGQIQPAENVWDWASHDKIYAAFQREGVMPAPVLGYSTRWGSTGDPNAQNWHLWANAPPRTDAFAKYAAEAVKRYGHLTHYWEIWNEPDIDFWLGTPEQYAQLVDATVSAIKAQQPDAQVMNGGFSETLRRPDFIPTYFKTTKNLPDILAVHSHMQFENLLREEVNTRKVLQEVGLTGAKQPRLWLNEAGYSSFRGSPEREQASQLVKKMAYTQAAGFGAYVWYDLRDDGTDDNEIEHNFGLVKRDFRPKAAAIAANTLMNNLGGRAFAERLPLDSNSFVLVNRGAGATVLTAWRQSATKTALSVPLLLRAVSPNGKAPQLEREDIFGNATKLESSNGVFFLNLDGTPQYVIASDPAVKFQLVGQSGMLLQFPPAVVLTAGENLRWPVKVSNPFEKPLIGQLSVAGGTPVAVQVPAASTKSYDLPLRATADPGTRQNVTVRLDSPQLPTPMEASTEMQIAFTVPAAPDVLTISPPRNNVVSLFEATPMQELHFKDAADLSATAKIQKTAGGIHVQLTVQDQTHVVVPEAGQWWRGDSVQWAIGLPDGRLYEWMGALLDDGPHMALNLSPDGKTGIPMPAAIRRDGTQTVYEWTIPSTLPDGTPLPSRFGFNFLVNDNDGAGRKGWLEWTPGIGRDKTPAAFMPLAAG